MTVAAFIVSMVALLVAGAAAFFTWQQADAARETVRLAKRQDLKDRAPEFDGEIESVNEWYRLNLRLKQGEPLAHVKVTITEGNGVQFAGSQDGAPGREPGTVAETVEPLRLGGLATWRLLLDETYSSEVRLEAVCRGHAGERWTAPVVVETPRQPFVY